MMLAYLYEYSINFASLHIKSISHSLRNAPDITYSHPEDN